LTHADLVQARKNGCIVNTGENPTREKVKKKKEENLARFGLTDEEIEAIIVPLPKASAVLGDSVRREKLARLSQLQAELAVAEEEGEVVKPSKKQRRGAPKELRLDEDDDFNDFEDFDNDEEEEVMPVKRPARKFLG